MRAVPENIPALTGVRAYAAVWVMLLHLQFSAGVSGNVRFGPLVGHGFWGVDIFFVLSGFILSLIYAQRFLEVEAGDRAGVYRDYLAARFARIYPLHLATLLALAAFVIVRAIVRQDFTQAPGSDSYHFALNVLLLHGWGYAQQLNWNYPSWSISCEWFAYLLLTPVLARGLGRSSLTVCLLAAAAAWTALYLALHSSGQLIGHQAVQWGVPRITAEFVLGYALFRGYERYVPGPRMADFMTLLGVATVVALAFLPNGAEWFLAPAIGLLILGLSRAGPLGKVVFANRVAVFWGERSYSIYMLHAVVQFFGGHLLIRWNPLADSAAGGWTLMVGYSAAVLLASHFAYQWIELPMRDRLRMSLSRQRDPVAVAAPKTGKPA